MNRNPYFDNAKAILIFLVVLGHLMSEYINYDKTISKVYLFIYFFHMPAFILISGFFAKKINQKGFLKNAAKKMLIPYLIFQTIYTVYYNLVYGDSIKATLSIPRWALWYLLSMFCWYVLLRLCNKLKYGVVISILFSVLIGYVAVVSEYLSLSRTFFFFPFFLIGYKLTKEHFEILHTKKKQLLSLVFLMILFAVVYFVFPLNIQNFILGKRAYKEVAIHSMTFAWMERLLAYTLMIVSTFSFLSLIPKKRLFFTGIGQTTLYVYLLHLFIIKYVQESFINDYIISNHQYWLLFIIPIVIVYLLSRKWVRRLTSLLIEQKMKAV